LPDDLILEILRRNRAVTNEINAFIDELSVNQVKFLLKFMLFNLDPAIAYSLTVQGVSEMKKYTKKKKKK